MRRGADLIRRARERSGLTQAALAQRSGVPQSVISEYETGRRDPSVTALDRLVGAAGMRLSLSDEPATLKEVRVRGAELRALLTGYGATNIEVFGSVARGDDDDASDVDLLVDLDPSVGLFALGRMRSSAEALLSRPVDIVPRSGLKSPIAAQVLRDAVPL